MLCPICQKSKNTVSNCCEVNGVIYRKRKCLDPECAAVIYTAEVEASGELEVKVRKVLRMNDAKYRVKRASKSGNPGEQ